MIGGLLMEKGRLELEGWKLASTSSGADLRRTLEMYHELGFDVYTEKVKPEECGECMSCYVASGETLYRIYTRAKDRADDFP
jgi:hypothetical protein